MQLESHFYKMLAGLEMYLKKQTTPLMSAVKEYEESKKSAYSLFEINKKMRRMFNLNFENTVSQENVHPIMATRQQNKSLKKHSSKKFKTNTKISLCMASMHKPLKMKK